MATYGAAADAFSRSFIEGFLGLQRLDVERERMAQEAADRERRYGLEQQREARAAELQQLDVRQRNAAFDEQQRLPTDLGDIYRASAAQPDTTRDRPFDTMDMPLPPNEPMVGSLTEVVPGRPAARTVQDVIQRGVDPGAFGRVSRLAPNALAPLGFETPQQVAESDRKRTAQTTIEHLFTMPPPATPEEYAKRSGQIAGALVQAGLLTGDQAVQRFQEMWRSNPQALTDFMGKVRGHIERIKADPASANMPAGARLREAFAMAISENPEILVQNPTVAKELGLDQLLKAPDKTPQAPIAVRGAGAGDPSAVYDPNTRQMIPVPGGGGGEGGGGKPAVVQPGGSVWIPGRGGQPGHFEQAGQKDEPTKDPLERQALDIVKKTFPDDTNPNHLKARQFVMEAMRREREDTINRLLAGDQVDMSPEAQAQRVQRIWDAANRIANPGAPAPAAPGTAPGAQSATPPPQSWLDFAGAGVPGGGLAIQAGRSAYDATRSLFRGREAPPTPQQAPPPAPPGGLPGGPTVPGPPAPAAAAPPAAPVAPTGPVLPPAATDPKPPPPNPTVEAARLEAQRLIQAGVPPNQVRARMKAAGW